MPDIECLSNLAASLLTHKKNKPFMERLLSQQYGTWHAVSRLADGMLNAVEMNHCIVANLSIAWLSCPGDLRAKDYCVVLFHAEDEGIAQTATCNRKSLEPR